jgi:penicillin-binding protein 2
MPNLKTEQFPISDATVEKVTDGMYGVVNEGGTAGQVKLQNVEFCGKSGTAQIINYDLRSRLGKTKEFKDNAWFVGYAPKRNPEIVVAVLVQGGGHGGVTSAPIARDIVKAYYDKKAGVIQQQTAVVPATPAPAPAADKPATARPAADKSASNKPASAKPATVLASASASDKPVATQPLVAKVGGPRR